MGGGVASPGSEILNWIFDKLSVATIFSSNFDDEEFTVIFSSLIVDITPELFIS